VDEEAPDASGSVPVRWGIAATGAIAGRMTEALATLPDADVVAVGSRAAASAERFAAEHGIPRAHASYRALFDDDEVDIVYIASPHSHHREMTIAALDAGRHVLCEKAFAFNATSAS
jgi:predicted dehydrogenase